MGNVQGSGSSDPQSPPERPPKPNSFSPGNVYPSLGDSDHDYEILRPSGPPVPNVGPVRPAPKPPTPITQQNSTHTLGSFQNALDGVPFVINPKFSSSSASNQVSIMKFLFLKFLLPIFLIRSFIVYFKNIFTYRFIQYFYLLFYKWRPSFGSFHLLSHELRSKL